MDRASQESTAQSCELPTSNKSRGLEEWYSDYMEAGQGVPEHTVLSMPNSVLDEVELDEDDGTYWEDQMSLAQENTHVSEGFCNRCLHLFSHWPDLKTWNSIKAERYRVAEIHCAAMQHCKLCSFLHSRLSLLHTELYSTSLARLFVKLEQRLARLQHDPATWISIRKERDTDLVWLNFPGKTVSQRLSWWTIHIKLETSVVAPSRASCPILQVGIGVADSRIVFGRDRLDSFHVSRKWLHDCTEGHTECCPEGNIERPTRLLFIANDTVKLILTRDLVTMPKYATLSYCWGRNDFLKLTPNNSEMLLSSIPWLDLPNTFKDAIFFARKVGLDYIWIDALCIVQQSEGDKDWLRESSLMRSIYGGSYLNIAAASSTSVQDGCFSVPNIFNNGFVARIQMPNRSMVYQFEARSSYEAATTKSYLASRAWALQERLLSPRTIFVGDQGLFWECKSQIASEFLPHGFKDPVPPDSMDSHVDFRNRNWDWDDIVMLYSRANLTNTSDKLPALAGIARRRHEMHGDEYLAGLWKEKLVKQLGWLSRMENPRPQWRAPSWSWASADGPVQYFPRWRNELKRKIEYVRVIEADVLLAGPDPFGPITAGQIHLACSAMVRGIYCGPIGHNDSTQRSARKHEIMIGAERLRTLVTMDYSVDGLLDVADTVYVLPLFEVDAVGMVPGGWMVLIQGMVLIRHGPVGGTFRRVGHFKAIANRITTDWINRGHGSRGNDYNIFSMLMTDAGPSTAESECVYVLSHGDDILAYPNDLKTRIETLKTRYVITVI